MKKALLLFFSLCLIQGIQAQIHVDSTATGANDGSSWANAYTKLQDGLANSSSGDTILVSKGTYYPDEGAGFTNNNRDSSFRLRDSVVLLGGFCTATGNTTLATRDWIAHPTTLSGDINQNNALGGNSYHVLTSSGLESVAVLDGFTITAGNANGTGIFEGFNRRFGGGMYNANSSPTITNTTFSENSATNDGGGMYNNNSSSIITNANFEDNTANVSGGGIFNDNGSNTTFTNVAITGNSALSFGGGGMYNRNSNTSIFNTIVNENVVNGGGAGIFNQNSDLDISGVTISGNTASDNGGGMYNENSSSIITNANFEDNTANVSGGGIFNDNGSNTTFTNVAITGNSALSFGGGGMYNRNSNTSIFNTIVNENVVNGGGAGIFNQNSDLDISGVTISGNTASDNGGGMYNENSSSIITNANFEDNTANVSGGGIFNDNGSNATFTNVAITGNSALSFGGGGMYNRNSNTSIFNTIVNENVVNGGGAGIFNQNSDLDISGVTISGNKASGNGGGMYNDESSPTISNTIIWNNCAASDQNTTSASINNVSSTPRISYSLIANAIDGSGNWVAAIGDSIANNKDTDPLFLMDVSNVCGTPTGGDLRLQANSPAINMGSNDSIPTGILSDLDGNQRIYNGTVDMGAYERFFCTDTSVLYVDASNPVNGDGLSWATAFQHLQDALQYGCDFDTILVAQGTYYPDTGGIAVSNSRSESFVIPDNVVLLGGYPSGGGARDFAANTTILSGDIDQTPNSLSNSYHVVRTTGVSATTQMDGFTVTGGNADGGSADDFGGGMLNENSSLISIVNCSFSGNIANNVGGGMYNDGGSPSITSCSFSENAANFGGGMFNDASSPSITNCSFNGNEANDDGGGMFNVFSSPSITNCSFSGNSALRGGGMYNINSQPHIANTIIWDNSASGVTSTPSASIFNASSTTPVISYSLIANSGGSGSWVLAIGQDNGNNKDVDPEFITPVPAAPTTAGNLRLQASSPAINMGSNDSIMATGVMVDLDSMPRILQGIVDMGAYERLDCDDVIVLYVDSSNTAGTQDGLSWATAFNTLQDALTYDCEVDSIFVSKGTYYPDEGTGFTDNSRDSSFRLRDSVVLLGGFCTATGDTTLATRDWIAHPTTLSGDIGTPNDSTDNSYHVLTSSGLDSMAVLDGFIITAGNADGTSSFGGFNRLFGGGMSNLNSSPTISNATFLGNNANISGGGMYNTGNSSPSINNATFSGNNAIINGGGMHNELNSSPSINNATFSGNNANGRGGGIHNSQSSPSINNSTFFGNNANNGGGMANIDNSSPTITNSTFSGNNASSFGGGMYNFNNSSPSITNATFSGNNANNDGGGMYNESNSSPIISNTIIWNNCVNGQTNTTTASIRNFNTSTPRISYSLIANSIDANGDWETAIGQDNGDNKDIDPQFITPISPPMLTTAGNLRLQAASPAINMGSNDSINATGVMVDLDSMPRIVDDIVDMGAYENQEAAAFERLFVRVLLSGPLGIGYNTASLMTDSLRAKGFIPLTSPYGTGETITDSASVLQEQGASSIVDWVLLELRDRNNSSIVRSTRSALVQRDGSVVDTNGAAIVLLDTMGNGGQDSFFIAVNHRNHLGAMTAQIQATNCAELIDFTDINGSFFSQGNAPQDSIHTPNVFALWPGDANQDNQVDRDDEQAVVRSKVVSDTENTFMLLNYIRMGYCPEDVNMDGSVIYAGQRNDIDVLMDAIYRHPQNGAQDPGFVIPEQLPSP